MFLFQRSLIYFPTPQDFYSCEGFKDYKKVAENGTSFYLKEQNPNNLIIYYHGNYGSACDRSFYKDVLEKTGNSLIYVEYAGYSDSKQKPSKELILKDIENINNYIKNNNYKNITVYGQSVGGGAASYHASIAKVNNVVLTSPFSTLKELAQSKYPFYPVGILLKENYNNIEWLKDFKGNVLILQGNKDRIIPPKFSKKLFDSLKAKNKEYKIIEGKGHNDIWQSEEFQNTLVDFIKINS